MTANRWVEKGGIFPLMLGIGEFPDVFQSTAT